MQARELLNFLKIIEKNKNNTRHSWTSGGRHESIAEHCWRTAVMALLVAPEFPGVDIEKVVKMCLIHDFGEAITGDIPSFLKTDKDERIEDTAVSELLGLLPEKLKSEFESLFKEMAELKTSEAKLFKAMDKLEAIISHNEASLDTWLPNEYELQLTYAFEEMTHSEYLINLRETIKQDSIKKINSSAHCAKKICSGAHCAPEEGGI